MTRASQRSAQNQGAGKKEPAAPVRRRNSGKQFRGTRVFIFPARRPPIPRASARNIARAILPSHDELSVAFVSAREIRRLNKIFRGTDAPTDILSFPLSRGSGELILCWKEIRKRAALFRRHPRNFALYLFIHGLLHLKGYRHGSRMERQEIKFRRTFGI